MNMVIPLSWLQNKLQQKLKFRREKKDTMNENDDNDNHDDDDNKVQ